MELKQTDSFLLKSLLLCAAGIIITQALGMGGITSVLFLMTFPLTVLLWLRSVRKTVMGMDFLMLLAALLATVNVLVDVSISGGRLSFDYIRKLIMFIMSLLFLQTAYRFRVGREISRFIDRMVDCLTLALIMLYYTDNSGMYQLNGYVTNYLTFRFSNPNTTGLFLVCMYMLELYRLFVPEKWYWKVVHIAMAGFLAWFVLETQSRNCLLVLLLFTVVCAWVEFRSKRRLCITKFWAVTISVFPLIFVGIYMLLIYTPWIQNTFSFLVAVGKKLDSRMEIWVQALDYIGTSPLIGSYYAISDGTGSAQLHNSHLDIAASYGIPIAIIVCMLLMQYLHQHGRYYSDKESYVCILGFGCTLLLGMGEAALFSGGLGIYIFVGLFLMLSNRETDEG